VTRVMIRDWDCGKQDLKESNELKGAMEDFGPWAMATFKDFCDLKVFDVLGTTIYLWPCSKKLLSQTK